VTLLSPIDRIEQGRRVRVGDIPHLETPLAEDPRPVVQGREAVFEVDAVNRDGHSDESQEESVVRDTGPDLEHQPCLTDPAFSVEYDHGLLGE